MPFEHFSVNAPASWDEVLSAEFGDYMTPVIGSADHRYPFYGHMEEELIRQIRNVVLRAVLMNSVKKFQAEDWSIIIEGTKKF